MCGSGQGIPGKRQTSAMVKPRQSQNSLWGQGWMSGRTQTNQDIKSASKASLGAGMLVVHPQDHKRCFPEVRGTGKQSWQIKQSKTLQPEDKSKEFLSQQRSWGIPLSPRLSPPHCSPFPHPGSQQGAPGSHFHTGVGVHSTQSPAGS